MHTRNAKGATLALIAASAVIIILVGVGLFFLMQIFGGFRELQHATDAGNLNVAKQALVEPHFTVQDNYQQDFVGLIDGQNGMDLMTYNRVVGQAFLVSMNAMADRPQGSPNGSPSPDGLAHAQIVSQAANGGDPGNSSNLGVGQKLFQMFSVKSNNKLFSKFSYVANRNSARMLNNASDIQHQDAGFDIAFMEPGGPTNVAIDPSLLPYKGDSGIKVGLADLPAGSVSTQKNKDNNPYLAGYVQIPCGSGGTTWNLVGVPVFPKNQPHLVSARDFNDAKAQNDTKFSGIVPPNAFKSISTSLNKSSNSNASAEAYSVVGVMNQEFVAQIPQGYIEVTNPRGYGGAPTPPPDDVYNKELMTGIYLGGTNGGGAAFSTDPNIIDQWAKYNTDPVNNPKPPTVDANGQPLVHFANSNDQPTDIKSAGYGGRSGSAPCMWNDVQGGGSSAPCNQLDQAFNNAYPPGTGQSVPQPSQMTAVEKLKYDVIHQYTDHDWANKCGVVNCPTAITLPDGTTQEGTGLRYWINSQGASGRSVTHGASSPIDPGSEVKISRPGTINELLTQTCPDQAPTILHQMAQRMHQINPLTSEATAYDWLVHNATTFELSTSYFIYCSGNNWVLTSVTPPGKHDVKNGAGAFVPVKSDGSLQRYASDPTDIAGGPGGYQTIDTMVNPHYENGIHLQYFTEGPDPNTASRGIDVIDWQPSSGYGNLLGTLTFRNFCAGTLAGSSNRGGNYCAPD